MDTFLTNGEFPYVPEKQLKVFMAPSRPASIPSSAGDDAASLHLYANTALSILLKV